MLKMLLLIRSYEKNAKVKHNYKLWHMENQLENTISSHNQICYYFLVLNFTITMGNYSQFSITNFLIFLLKTEQNNEKMLTNVPKFHIFSENPFFISFCDLDNYAMIVFVLTSHQ